MKTNLQLVLLVAFAVATGVLGTLLVQGQTAEAQPQPFQQCFAGRQETVDIDNSGTVHVPGPNSPRRINVPSGWGILGGGAAPGYAVLIFCR